MSDPPVGLKSIIERVNNIEKVISDDVKNIGSFVGNTINDIKNEQFNKLTNDISTFVEAFKKNIPENIDAYHDIVQLCSYAVKYVENYIVSFAKIINKNVTSSFKLQTCINLVKEISDKFDDTFLMKTINHLVSLLFPKSNNIEIKRSDSVSKKTGKALTCFIKKK